MILIASLVQGVYATVVRPQAAAVAARDAALMAKDANYVPPRTST